MVPMESVLIQSQHHHHHHSTVADSTSLRKSSNNHHYATQQQRPRSSNSGNIIIDGESFDIEYLYGWQVSWKEIIANSVIYLDGSTGDKPTGMGSRDKMRSALKLHCFNLQAKVVDFFNADEVTLIITRRIFDKSVNYPPNDIFHHQDKIRIWSFEKASRFFRKITVHFELRPEIKNRYKKSAVSYQYLKENEIKRFEQVKIEKKKDLKKDELIVKKNRLQISAKKKKESNVMFISPNEIHTNNNNSNSHNNDDSLLTNPIQTSLIHNNNIQHNHNNHDHNNNRMSLIKSLRKTSQSLPKVQTPQKLNYQQQVFEMLKVKKSQPSTQSSIPPQISTAKIIKNNNNNNSNKSHIKPFYKANDKLATLLTKEKLFGPTDRDFSIKQQDFYYFENPYVFAYDLRQQYRPIIISEWNTKNYSNLGIQAPWARIYPSVDGRCLFAADSFDPEHPSIVKRRQLMFESKKKLRAKLKSIFTMEPDHDDYDDSDYDSDFLIEDYNINSSKLSFKRLPITERQQYENQKPVPKTVNNDSIIPPLENINPKKRSLNDMYASGITQSNCASTIITSIPLNNGPSQSHVSSKEFKSLKKRIYGKDNREIGQQINKKPKLFKIEETKNLNETNNNDQLKKNLISPQEYQGYCETCRIKYQSFQKHITESKHREFAKNSKNFEKIDHFINCLRENKPLYD